MTCKNCGGNIVGDGITTVMRCEFALDYHDKEPDAGVVECSPYTDQCPQCGKEMVGGNNMSGVKCPDTKGCGYWFCF